MARYSLRRFDGLYRKTAQLALRTWQSSPWRRWVLLVTVTLTITSLIGLNFFIANDARAAVASNGEFFYGDSVDNGNMNFRTFTDTTTVGAEATSVATDTTNDISWIRAAAAPAREEIAAAHIKNTGRLDVVTCTSGCDASGDWTLRATYSTAVTDASAENMRPLDIAYEQLSGHLIVFFADDNTTGTIYYCEWDGSSWTPSTECSGGTFAPGTGNDVDLTGVGVTGQPEWIRAEPRGDRLTTGRSDEILLAVSDSADDMWLAKWDGSAVTQAANPVDDLTATNAQKFDIAWEETTGEGLAVFTDVADAALRFSTYTSGGGWSAADTTNGPTNPATTAWNSWLELATDPTSDDIALIGALTTPDADAAVWTGSSWTNSGTNLTDQETVTGKNVAVEFERFSGRAIFYNVGLNDLNVDAHCWTSGGGFTALNTAVGTWTTTDDVEDVVVVGSPNSNKMLGGAHDIVDDLEGFVYSAATGCADGDFVNTSTATLNAATEGVTGNTIRLSHTPVYKPYAPWTRNWRFYDDETVNTPTTGLNGAAENATPTGVDPEEFIRLRININETGNMAQTDTRKKLQYTSGCTPNSAGGEAGCTWTDVGDTGETTAVWRYATSGETCSNCSDNTALGTANLTGSTQSGSYVSDKDAAGGTNMDHNALAIVEYDFPLKAEDVAGNTTYYFRLYEPRISNNGQDSAIFREQDADGNNDCASATCTYPSLTTAAGSITVSGGCFTDETEGAACGDAGAEQIKVAVNGVVDAGSDGTVDGSWSFTITAPSSGDILVFFVDGEGTDTEEATTVVKYDGTGNVDLVKMYQSQLVIGTDSGSANSNQTITVADLDTTTNGYENSDDEDVIYDVTAGADLTVDAETDKTEQLYIMNGETFRPASGGGSDVTTAFLEIDTSATWTADSNAITVNGTSGTLFTNGGTFTQGTSTVNVTSASGTPTFLSGATSFHILTINAAATVINMGSAVTINAVNGAQLNITSGVFNVDANNITGPGAGTGRELTIGSGARLCLGGTTSSTSATCNNGATQTATRDMPSFNTYTFNSASTVSYLSNVAQTVDSTPTYGHLILNPIITAGRIYTFEGATTINGNFDINPDAASALALTVNMAGDITVAATTTTTITRTGSNATSLLDTRPVSTDYHLSTGLLNITAGGTLDATSAASNITLTGTSGTLFTVAGTFTEGSSTVIFNGNGSPTALNGNTAEASNFNNLSLTPALSTSGKTYAFGTTALSIAGNFLIHPSGDQLLTVNPAANITVAATGTTTITRTSTATATLDLRPSTTDYNLTTGALTIATGGTLDAGSSASAINIAASYSNSGTFTSGSSTVTFNSTSTGRTLSGTLNGSSAFHNVIFNGTGGEWSINATTLINNDLTVTNGNVIGASDIQVNGGDMICGASCGTTGFTGGTFTLNGTGNFGTTALASNWTFNNLTIGTASINTTTAQGTGTITISGVLAFDSSNTVNAGAKTYVLAGTNGTPFTNAGSIFNANTSTFRYTGNNGGGDTNIYNDAYWNLELNNGSETYVLTGSQGVSNDLTITAGTLDVTATPHALTISGNYSNSGNFNSRTGTVTFDATDSGNTLAGEMTGSNDDFHNLVFNGVSGAWGFSAAVETAQDFTVTNGAVTANNNALTVVRDFTLANTSGVSYTAGSSTLTISRHYNDTGNKFVRGTSTVTLNGTGNVNTTGNFNNLSYAYTSQVSTLNTSNFSVHGQMTFNGGTANATAGGYIGLERSSSGTPIVFASASTLSGSKSMYHSNNANSLTTTIAAGNYGTWNVISFTTGAYTSSTYQLAGNISTTGYVTLQAHNSSTGNVWNTQDFDVTALRFDLGSESRVGPWTVNFGAADFDLTDTGSSFGVVNNGGTHTFNLSTANIVTDGDIRFVQGTGTVAASGSTSTITMTPAAAATRTFYTNAQTIDNFVVNGGAGSTVLLNGDLIPSDNLTITAGTFDVSASNYIVTIGGNYSNSGTFDARASTVVFNATDTGNTMAGTMTGSSAFFALTFNGSGGEWTPSAAITVEQHLTMTAGTLLGSQNITVNQNVQGTNGIINLSGGTFEQRSNDTSRDFGTTSGSAAWSFNDLTFSDSCGVCVPGNITFTTQTGGSGGITVGGVLRVGLAADPDNVTLNAGNRTWTLSGTGGDPFQLDTGSNLTPSTSTFTFSGNNGSGDTTVQTETYNILTVNNGSETYNLEGATAAVNVTVSAGILALNSQTLQATGDLTVNGTLSGTTNVTVANNATGTGTITLTGGTFSITDSACGNFGTTSGTNNWTFNDLTFKENGDFSGMTVTTQTGGSGTITVGGILTVGNATDGTGTTLDAGNRTWTLSGTGGNPFQLVGTAPNLTPSTSTFAYTGNNGSGDTTVQSETYNILQVNNGSEIYNLEAATSSLDTTVSAGTLALNGQTLAATNDLTVNGTLSGSTNVTVNGSVTGSGTITLGGGLFTHRITANANETFGSTSGSNNWTFSSLTFRNSDSNNHSTTFNSTGSGQVIVSATLTIGSVSDSNTLTLDNDTNDRILDVNGSVTIASTAIFEPSSAASFTVADDWSNSGTFNHNNGTVTFDTTTTATIAGATTFYGFRSVTAAKTIQFTAGQTFTIDTGGLLTLTGTADPNEIQIQSTTSSQWFINHQGTESVSFVQVINSGCDGASTNISTSDSVDDGNNGACWQFGSDFSQEDFRFGQPNGLDIDYTGAPAENAAYTTSGTSDDFRLRMLIHVSGSNLAQNGNDFKLQFGEKTAATCTSGVSWGDVSDSSGVIRYFNGGGRNDGDNLTGNAGDPAHGAHVTVNQDYEEANNFTNSVSAINSGQDGLWDFSLVNHSAVGGKRYCFKIVDVTGGNIDLTAYNQYPEVIVDEELIFTLDATSKDFGVIQPGGNPTDVSSTLTATTNSSTGYVVYAWSTQLMTMGAFTLPDWTGTNASPTTFGNGSFGFGYTTDDASLTGGTADRFTNGGAKYAGFVHSGPGDPVADRTTGPVSSQQNIIGYRIAASGDQAAGPYNTAIVYVISVTF